MTRFMLAILFALPLAVLVGCGDQSECASDEDCTGNTDCQDADCGGDDDTVTTDQFEATLHSVAPYGWVGDHYVYPVDDHAGSPSCEGVNECPTALDDDGNYRVAIWSETFACVPQTYMVSENDDGNTVDVTSPWTGEGVCGLWSDGDYSGWDVSTNIGDLDGDGTDEVVIYIGSWESIVTGNTFYYEDNEYLLEGKIADDLSSIDYYLGAPGTSGGARTTI